MLGRFRRWLNAQFSKRAGILFLAPGILIAMDACLTLHGQGEDYWGYFMQKPYGIYAFYEEHDVLKDTKGAALVIQPGFIQQYTSIGKGLSAPVLPSTCPFFTQPKIPYLYLAPQCAGTDTSQFSSIAVNVNTGPSLKAVRVAVYIQFDTTRLELLAITTNFSQFPLGENSVSGDTIKIFRHTNPGNSVSGDGHLIANLNFGIKAKPGLADVKLLFVSTEEGPSKVEAIGFIHELNPLGEFILWISPLEFIVLTFSYLAIIYLAVMFGRSNWIRFSAFIIPPFFHANALQSWIVTSSGSFTNYFFKNIPLDPGTKIAIGTYGFYIFALALYVISLYIYDRRRERGEI